MEENHKVGSFDDKRFLSDSTVNGSEAVKILRGETMR